MYVAKLEFPEGGGGVQTKKPSMAGVFWNNTMFYFGTLRMNTVIHVCGCERTGDNLPRPQLWLKMYHSQ